jgi:hypothetical protein
MNKEPISFIEASYSGHRYEIYAVNPDEHFGYHYAIRSTLTPYLNLSLAVTPEQAVRVAKSIRDRHYAEYLEALSAEVERRGYTDAQVVDLIHIQRIIEKLRTGEKVSKGDMRTLEEASKRVPPEMVTDAMLLHAQRAWKAYLESDDENTLEWFVADVTKG